MSIDTSTQSPPPASARPPQKVVLRVLATQLLLAALVAVAFLVLYAGLQRDPQPRHVAVSVVGHAQSVAVQQGLGGAVTVTEAADSRTAQDAVRRRTAIAAFDMSTTSLHVYTAGANGFADNSAIEQLAAGFARASGLHVETTDLIPLVPFDPRSLAALYTVLSMTVGSFILGQALHALRVLASVKARLITAATFALLTSVLIAVLVGPVLQVLPAAQWALMLVLSLQSLAVSLTTLALTSLFNSYGIFAATLIMTALGLSTSGGIIAQDLLPAPLGIIGSLLPPGAALRAVVTISYFDPDAVVIPVLTLSGWLALGLAGLLLHARKAQRHLGTRSLPPAVART